LLRAKLQDEKLQPHAYCSVLEALIAAGDEEAAGIARDLVTSAANSAPEAIEKPLQAAFVLLQGDPPRGWEVVWPTCQSNAAFAEALFSRFATDPYSLATTRLVTGVGETELAELQIWLYQHHLKQDEDDGAHHLGPRAGGFTMITSNRGWHSLSMVVMSNLIERGTPAAREAIHEIKEAAPEVNLDRAEKAAEEVVRQKTWEPLSPSELIDLVTVGPVAQESPTPVPLVATPPQSEPAAAPGVESRLAAKQQAKRKKIGSAWIDLQRSQKQWTSDAEIADHGGPTYNTIRRYRSGQESTRDPYVRGLFAAAFACDISKVPK